MVGWLDEGRPLALNWIFLRRDKTKLRGLSHWGGMYPALAPGEGQAENLIVFPPALRIPGGSRTYSVRLAATAATLGVHTLYSHIHAKNHRARRWLESAGWHAYGSIFRMRVVPGWEFHLYLHETRVALPIAAQSPTKVAGYPDLPT